MEQQQDKEKRQHAVEIVRKRFSVGLAGLCDQKFLSRR